MHELPLAIYEQQSLLITLFWVLESNHVHFAWLCLDGKVSPCPLPTRLLEFLFKSGSPIQLQHLCIASLKTTAIAVLFKVSGLSIIKAFINALVKGVL